MGKDHKDAMKSGSHCWPGYERVPGKEPHSQGSCRPKASAKLTKSERDFREARKRQLDRWQQEHPNSPRSAAQHLLAASKRTRKPS
jgi:hypothetical protein